MFKLALRDTFSVLALPRSVKRLVVVIVDVSLCTLSVWLAYYLRLGEFVYLSGSALKAVLLSLLVALPIFMILGLYRVVFRYVGFPALLLVARATFVYGSVYAALVTILGIDGVPRTIGLIQPILLFLFIGISRLTARIWLDANKSSITRSKVKLNALIYGAGSTGRQLLSALTHTSEIQVIGFIDDDKRLQGNFIDGLLVYSVDECHKLAANNQATDVLLAMPNLRRTERRKILEQLSQAKVKVRNMPRFSDLASGKVGISSLLDLDIFDLIGREPVVPSQKLLAKNVEKKIIFVTGAGGSIGSEICRQVIRVNPEKLLLLEQSEHALYKIHQELEQLNTQVDLIPLLGSVTDKERVEGILKTYRPNTVYHCAAYKHVPIVEYNMIEGIKNNVFGTLTVALAALDSKVENLVFISTDKAIRSKNVMGASKRLSEMILQSIAKTQNHACISMVRFGNVLGSSGSVVPKFREQISDGGPVTLTHKGITRFFMTIPEAAQLVIQAGGLAKGGEVFVLDMGEPVKIIDLARRMIELSGLTVKDEKNQIGDIEILVTGLRPGEKLYEELLISGKPKKTSHERILMTTESVLEWPILKKELKKLEGALIRYQIEEAREMLVKLVPDYEAEMIVDWMVPSDRPNL